MSKQVIYSSPELNGVDQLQDALNKAVAALATRENPFNVTLVTTLRLKVVQETLTDGSKVYDVSVTEE